MAERTERPIARANAHLNAGRIAEAEGAFNAVLSLDPDEVQAHVGLADCAYRSGNLDGAIERLAEEARALAVRGQTQSAFVLLTKALSLAPDRMELHIDVADVESRAGRSGLAAQRLENLARAYLAAGAEEDAALVLEAAAAFRSPPELEEPAPVPCDENRTTMTGRAVTLEPPKPNITPPPVWVKPKTSSKRQAKRVSPPSPPPASKEKATVEVPCQASKPAPKRARKRSNAAPRWRPPTASNPTVPKAEAVQVDVEEAQTTKPRLTLTPAPRPRTPAKPISRSITPAPSPKRGGKKLARLPAVGEGGVAALLQRPPVGKKRADFIEDETTSMWRRPSS